jgi:two-component system, NtrC family, sensor kinase
MKIVPKLTLAIVTATCAALAVNGYFRVHREVAAFEADLLRDHELIGRSLGATVTAVWKLEGEGPAMRSIGAVNEHFQRVHIRWRDARQPGAMNVEPPLPPGAAPGKPVTRLVRRPNEASTWQTYVPIDVDGNRRGLIEISEPASHVQRVEHTVITDTMAMAGALALLSAFLSFAMGQWLVGVPVNILVQKARRIGAGDFSGPVVLKQKDELATLGREINAMCERLATTVDQLRHADRLATVGKLASGVAHELGTPLNVVSARARMIATGETTPEETATYARAIGGAADRMTRIIQQLLQFARRKKAHKALRDLRDLTKDAIDLLRPLADRRNVKIDMAASGDDTRTFVDPDQLQQVVTNLTMNAIQAMPKGGVIAVDLRVDRALPPQDVGTAEIDCVCLRLADQGSGIAPDALPHLFEPFFTTKDVGEGTGLGLAVSDGIVRDHGGWIAVDSKVDVGTTFTVFLPKSSTA